MKTNGAAIDESGWVQPDLPPVSRRGGARPGSGRKKKDDTLQWKTVGLTPEQWLWLSTWMPTGSPSNQLRELLERAEKFWPAGPSRFR